MLAALRKLSSRGDLSEDEARDAMASVMRGEASPVQIAGLAMGLAGKGVTALETVTLARTVMESAHPFPGGSDVLDTCGTGGDGHDTFNISSTVAIVTAACGVPVAKHGSRSVSSQCGSADLLEALGVDIELTPQAASRCLDRVGITFLSATVFHPTFGYAMGSLRELRTRTVFNVLGPLCNPASARYRIIGVSDEGMLPLLAEALPRLGCQHALAFWSRDGMDELSLSAPARVVEVRDTSADHYELDPRALGLAPAAPSALAGGPPARNAALVREVLAGAAGPRRDVVLLNAAAALRAADRCAEWRDGVERAAAAIDSGAAGALLDRWVATSQALGRPAPG
ncbi:anthranilate phosphoribosyltransferase [Streptomyces sp. TRM 70351]|uniref:anthranilate phosphoribosyltransferase n=1 Tax=Streptomyces sp. TRM 70351 TaxID=3116552 RepID=UPI002E7B2D62|nr:anthranilate phosphoribosyltransferase [Streptomyces sp. TRM 70351]MEE1926688.1 anthranilate phosphoribosyltransferase [Streptomyces sp. TRM 70351]